MYNNVLEFVNLVPSETEVDIYGDPVLVEEKRMVFCKELSVGQTEFYQAQTLFYKPEIKFEIADYMDYQREQFVDYEGIRYKILRTYKNSNKLEITCYDGVRQ